MHPALRDIQAQVSIDLVFSGPQADVQGFFDQQHRVLGGFIQYADITPVYCVSILPSMLCHCSQLVYYSVQLMEEGPLEVSVHTVTMTRAVLESSSAD